MRILTALERRKARNLLSLPAVLLLGACGGGGPAAPAAGAAVTHSVTLEVQLPASPADLSVQAALPPFHVAPVLLDAPEAIDSWQPDVSAHRAPHTQSVPAQLAGLSTRRLTLERLRLAALYGASEPSADDANPTPLASGSVVATYTPAQIRAAYGLPPLPAAGSTATSVQAAQQGAGQTIYLIDAYDDPNSAAELATFDGQFGLPGCTSTKIAVSAPLPLAAAASTGCSFSVVYSAASGGRTATEPAYNSDWATEIALDVQWAHATAPMARIVLIEAPDPSVASLVAAVDVANSMGPGVVSMSFGSSEGSWTAQQDPAFTVAGMTYLAAAGDAGAEVEWPAVSAHVLAVGGTSLTWPGGGTRTEVVWSDTGGGVSQYTPAPAYQTSAVPDMGTPVYREVSDVSFNADPSTGEYLAVISPGTTTVGWLSAGGTSLATPQWAGLMAVANALRAQSAQAPLGDPHAELYGGIATVAGNYASAFLDVTQGSDGSCATCYAEVGYDLPSGLGTPNASSLLAFLESSAPPAPAPVVKPASIAGTAATALSFSVSVTAADPVSFALGNAPAGMSIGAAGVVSWPAPVAGTFAVTVTATDTETGLSGHGTYTVSIAPAPKPPVVASVTVNGTAGTALTHSVSVTDANAHTLTMSGAPSGMTLSSAGVFAWSNPLEGTYPVTVTATDSKTGLTGVGVITFVIAPAKPPMVANTAVSGHVGAALSVTVPVTHANPVTYALSGAPAGMSISGTGVLGWSSPAAGQYAVSVSATDTKTGLAGEGIVTVTILPAGPVITAAAISGVAGEALTGKIALSDATSSSLTVTITGVPTGMTFSWSRSAITLKWASPVAGSYTLGVSVQDTSGRSAVASIPLTISGP